MTYWSTLPHTDVTVSQGNLDRMIAQSPLTYFVIDLHGRAIGCAGMHAAPEVGFILHPDHWRNGFVSEAMTAILPYLFATSDLPALLADIDPRNVASRALLGRLGFRHTHDAQNTYCIEGTWSDSAYYASVRPTA